MLIKKLIWIYILFMLFSPSSANGDYVIPSINIDNNGSFLISQRLINNIDFKGEPSYLIEVQTSSIRANTGDNFSIKIFLSGVGDAVLGKMRVNIPAYIVKDGRVILKTINYNYSIGSKTNEIILHPFVSIMNQSPQLDLNIPNIYFNPRDIKAFVNFGEVTLFQDGTVPYTLNFSISPKAPGGDHNIHIKLFYKYGNKWYSDTQVVPLHINNWYEQEWMQWLVLGSLCISIFLQMISAIPVIEDYRKKRKGKITPPK